MLKVADILKSRVYSLARLRESISRRIQERRTRKADIRITNERGVPRKESISVQAVVLTPDYKFRRFPCNGLEYNEINEGKIPDGLPQWVIDSLKFNRDLQEQGPEVLEAAMDRALGRTSGNETGMH